MSLSNLCYSFRTSTSIHLPFQDMTKLENTKFSSVLSRDGFINFNFNDDNIPKKKLENISNPPASVVEFLSIRKKNRYSKGFAFSNQENTINCHTMNLSNDIDYLKLVENRPSDKKDVGLRRCHVVFTDGTNVHDFGAHNKFYNMDTNGIECTQQSWLLGQESQGKIKSVQLDEKISGSQILMVISPKEWQYDFLFQFFSKSSTNNIYSNLAGEAFMEIIGGKDHLQRVYDILQDENIASLTGEVMGLDRHVSMDQSDELGSSFILHGGAFRDGNLMTMEELRDLGKKIGLKVVKNLYSSTSETQKPFTEALKVYHDYDVEGNINEGGVMTIVYTDGHIQKLKCKSWWYLYLREMREMIPQKTITGVAPYMEQAKDRLKIFGCPEKTINFFASKMILWWYWVRASFETPEVLPHLANKDHPVVIDNFIEKFMKDRSEGYLQRDLDLINQFQTKINAMPIFVNVGISGSGKSTTAKQINPNVFVISQDDCGTRKNLVDKITTLVVRDHIVKKKGEDPFVIDIDRTNLTKQHRFQVLNELSRSLVKNTQKPLALVPIFLVHTSKESGVSVPDEVIERVVGRKSHPTLSVKQMGLINICEILKEQLDSYQKCEDGVQLFIEDTVENKVGKIRDYLKKTHPHLFAKVDKKPGHGIKFGLDEKQIYRPNIDYKGVATPCMSSIVKKFGSFDKFKSENPKAKEHNSHITLLHYRQNPKNLSLTCKEGSQIDIIWIGTFEQKNSVCGSLVEVPGYDELFHITGWTADGVAPFQSNPVINGFVGVEKGEAKPSLKHFREKISKSFEKDDLSVVIFDEPRKIKGYLGTHTQNK